MAKIVRIGRVLVESLVRQAQSEGLSANALLRKMRAANQPYRRQDLQTVWRNIGNIKKKEGLLKYVRKDYLPSAEIAYVKDWEMSREYLFKLKIRYREAAGKPIQEKFVNITSDKALTPRQMEQEVVAQWGKWYGRKIQDIHDIVAETAIQRQP